MNKYILKRGVFLRQIGLLPLCESTLRDNDKLAEDYLKNDPTLIRYFDSAPIVKAAPVEIKTVKTIKEVEIIEPKKVEVIPVEPKEAVIEEEPVEVIKAVRKPRKRAKIKK